MAAFLDRQVGQNFKKRPMWLDERSVAQGFSPVAGRFNESHNQFKVLLPCLKLMRVQLWNLPKQDCWKQESLCFLADHLSFWQLQASTTVRHEFWFLQQHFILPSKSLLTYRYVCVLRNSDACVLNFPIQPQNKGISSGTACCFYVPGGYLDCALFKLGYAS